MPPDLPGFYYDPEKNRYFPLKGPIPGSVRKTAPVQNSVSEATEVRSFLRKAIRNAKLLQDRELYGNIISTRKRKGSFQEEYMKTLVSRPMVWKYQGTKKNANAALGLMHANVETPVGQFGTDFLLTGGANGSLSLFEVGKKGQQFCHAQKQTAMRIWPSTIDSQKEFCKDLKHIWKLSNGASFLCSSNISCISMPRKQAFHPENDASTASFAVVTTLGSESCSGALYVLNLGNPLELNSQSPVIGRSLEVASLNCTIWTADCNSSGSKAVIGTNLGVTSVNLETGVPLTLCRSKSDVLCLQLIQSGNIALCGFRNGAILTVDSRQRQRQLARHHIPYPSPKLCGTSSRTSSTRDKPWFVLRGHIHPSDTIYMPSSVSCLASLQLYDQYFLASSMDGSIKLYDHRLIQRGAIQSYEGHVNSHTRIHLGVDTYERFVLSGGEDSSVGIWSIKSGELLYRDKFSNSIPSAVSWQLSEESPKVPIGRERDEDECQGGRDHIWGAWLGSEEGLFWMQFM
ncbi:hypothetical protein Nepgr_027781 [Nepenthes gracilis]|uniref:Uncharacterized protein n=1 Tax=Nepenthes gracilis TaxID=150966 RepID=A0AAD3T9D5_NEPGR|nr:hypothetical protein Nepgr_027781 [Nepenthes gracilis]